jgi:hypothetical protein
MTAEVSNCLPSNALPDFRYPSPTCNPTPIMVTMIVACIGSSPNTFMNHRKNYGLREVFRTLCNQLIIFITPIEMKL